MYATVTNPSQNTPEEYITKILNSKCTLLQQKLPKTHPRNGPTTPRFWMQNVYYCSKSGFKYIQGIKHRKSERKMYAAAANPFQNTSNEYIIEILNAKCMLLQQIFLKIHPRNTSRRFRTRNVCYCTKSFPKHTRWIHHQDAKFKIYATAASPCQNTPEEYIIEIQNAKCMLLQQILANTTPRNTSLRFSIQNVCYCSESYLKHIRGIHHRDSECEMWAYTSKIQNAKCILRQQIGFKDIQGIYHLDSECEMYATAANPCQNTPEEYIIEILNAKCMPLQQVLAKTHPRNTSRRFSIQNMCYCSKCFLKQTRGMGLLHQDSEYKIYTAAANQVLKTSKEYIT